MIFCAYSNENHSSACTTIRVFLNSFVSLGTEREWEGIGITFGNKRELDYSLKFPKAGNEAMGMEGNGYTKVFPAHLYSLPLRSTRFTSCFLCLNPVSPAHSRRL